MADRTRRPRSKPHTFNALVAAAEVITSKSIRRNVTVDKVLPWQERAWQFYDDVGEFRFGVSWIANAMSRVNLVAAIPPNSIGDEPTPINSDDPDVDAAQRRAAELVAHIAGGVTGQGQMMAAFGRLLTVGGFAWLVAEPDLDDPDADVYERWQVFSQDALDVRETSDTTSIRVRRASGTTTNAWRHVHPNALVVKCWRPHPRRPWEPDAPVRAVLGVLDQIDLITAHVTATGRSRLAGAGVFAIPSEAEFPDPPAPNDAATPRDPFDYFVDQMIEAMTTPIRDRDNASAIVPLMVQVPGEYVDKLKHITFSTPFDAQALALLQESIKRLSLGMDMPPEVLTGMSGVNHWTAWQVEDTAITLHIDPTAEIVCQALTEGYLKPALEAEGFDPSVALVWYDTGDLTMPPDRSRNVVEAYDRVEASGEALRRYLGLSENDKPDDDEEARRRLLGAAERLPSAAPSILGLLGLLPDPDRVEVITEVAEAAEPEALPAAPEPTETRPSTDDRPAAVNAAAVIAACDGVVHRALERAGSRLRSAIGRKVPGGPQAVECADPAVLHTHYDATIYADLDRLLEGAFDRVPEVASPLKVDAAALTATLNAYCRALLASGHAHDRTRLAAALGADATI